MLPLELIERIFSALTQTEGPVAIHAGHFQLEADLRSGAVYAAVAEELTIRDSAVQLREMVQERVGIFPIATFRFAIELATRLKAVGRRVQIFTLVNDLTPSIRHAPQGAGKARRAFYQDHPGTLHIYEQMMREQSLNPEEVLGHVQNRVLISETWLRRKRFKARLKRGTKLDHAQNELIQSMDSSFTLEGLSCPIMSQGQATCAGEVCELHMQLSEAGFRTFVNFYPQVCRGFVEASLEVADRLWGLENYQSIEIALNETGAQSMEELLDGLRIRIQ